MASPFSFGNPTEPSSIVCDCVFCLVPAPLTLPLINEKKSTNKALAFSSYFKQQRSGHEQIMVLSKVLNDEVNVGYHGWTNMLLKSVRLDYSFVLSSDVLISCTKHVKFVYFR